MCRKCTNKVYKRDTLQAHLNSIRCRAKGKGVAFNLTKEDLTIPEKCPVLGIPLLSKWGASDKELAKDNAPSVDRLIPELGYVKGNTAVISVRANRIKTNATKDEIFKVYQWLESRSKA